jgi:hypothetical protein
MNIVLERMVIEMGKKRKMKTWYVQVVETVVSERVILVGAESLKKAIEIAKEVYEKSLAIMPVETDRVMRFSRYKTRSSEVRVIRGRGGR